MDVTTLERRRCYRISARNLRVAVFDGEGFTGIRTKFDERYLDTEYPNHTVRTATPMAAWVPEYVSLATHTGSQCLTCGAPARWGGPPAPAPWHCEGPCAPEAVRPMAVMNTELFAFLDSLDEQHPPIT